MSDKETGETVVFDQETGETLRVCVDYQVPATDAETGEPSTKSKCVKRHFHVPKDLYKDGSVDAERNDRLIPLSSVMPHRTALQPVCCIEEKVVSGSQNMSPIVFMLPTLFLFPAWASVLCVFTELIIHMWAHKRNRLPQESPVVCYKSPLNMITSEFCAICRSEKIMNRIGKLQDERKLQIDNRKLQAYMNKVSSIVT